MGVDVTESANESMDRRERLARLLEDRAGEDARRKVSELLSERLGANVTEWEIVSPRGGRKFYSEAMEILERQYQEKTSSVGLRSWSDVQSWVSDDIERLRGPGRALVVMGHSDTVGVVRCEWRSLEVVCLELLRQDGELVLVLDSSRTQGFVLDLECAEGEFVVRALGW